MCRYYRKKRDDCEAILRIGRFPSPRFVSQPELSPPFPRPKKEEMDSHQSQHSSLERPVFKMHWIQCPEHRSFE